MAMGSDHLGGSLERVKKKAIIGEREMVEEANGEAFGTWNAGERGMAKALSTVIGVDLGRHAIKAVVLERKSGDRWVLADYAWEAMGEGENGMSDGLREVFRRLGGGGRGCAVAVSSGGALVRIIEQPETPVKILRDALRLNGVALMNQDCREFVLDCDEMKGGEGGVVHAGERKRYLVGGLPRVEVVRVGRAVEGSGGKVSAMQIGAICLSNAFEFGHRAEYMGGTFFLVDLGKSSSTVVVGRCGELLLVRSIEIGGKTLLEGMSQLSGESEEAVKGALEEEDEVMMEYGRLAVGGLVREVQSSMGFLENLHEETAEKIYVSGGGAKSLGLMKLLSESLGIPCEPWSVLGKCEVGDLGKRRVGYERESMDLLVAMGAAVELLEGR